MKSLAIQLALCLCCLTQPLAAQIVSDIVKTGPALAYARERVFIQSEVTLPPLPAPEAGENNEANDAPPKPRREQRQYFFDTEIRPEESLQMEWFYSLANIQEGRASMTVMKEAGPLTLPKARLYKPVDVLVIGEDGAILAILPEIKLNEQPRQIEVDMPVKALLYIHPGTAASLQIKPKDMVKHKIFTANPVVLQ